MLRVTTLYASSAAATASYYTQYLTQAPDEAPGAWAGRQAAGLGLAGEVTPDALEALLSGCDPIGGRQLGNLLVDRTLADGRVVRAVAGFDATFSAPKSVSVLWALTGDARLLAAHDAAVRAALAHLERYGSTTRVRSNGGRLHLDTVGLSMATFRQTTSRADDPQLHTHAVISAKVHTPDGRWLALDARYLKRHQRMLGGLYQSVLRAELAHRFGAVWGPIEKGQAEIVGVAPELLEVFSKRTAQVDAAFDTKLAEFRERQGREPTRWERAALTREAAADTRAHKTGNGTGDLRARWLTEAVEVGYRPVEVVASVRHARRDQGRENVPRLTVDGIVDALSASGSTWNRADVMRAICDTQRPLPTMTAERWATALEQAADQVIQACVNLDPDDTAQPRRVSDGRSVWLEPASPHVTSPAVLAEEEYVLSWAIDAQLDDPRPSTTVNTRGLDVLQADVAAAVAGADRLVLAVGPAGAGKTTTLRAAADDLAAQGRPVFGVAPSAKAARVLQRDTGIGSDTLAKLLHEWKQHGRPPGAAWRLPAGTTVIVDEAGMVGTPSLAQLARLADAQRWRVVLTGDPYQLQAVGRGGLFAELCATGRIHHLERIHRFTNTWEAAASLKLRHGDPRAVDVYEAHGRIVADTFDGHLDRIARMWLDTTAEGGTVAITASTNAHVDAINAAVQAARLDSGQLDTTAHATIAGDERAYIGDVVVTRRNDRQLTTSDGEPVRNREQWTVAAVHRDGSLTVSSGTGRVILPTDYTTEHVRLGYAATEHGNQGDTTTVGIQLATPATTRRGLYVGATRGRDTNLILAVTPTGDPAEARDVLDGILASDRADLPATVQRRALTETARPERQPRCAIPAWFDDLRTTTHTRLADAEARAATDAQHLADIENRLSETRRRLDAATRTRAPHQPALDEAAASVQHAREQQRAANAQLRQAGRLQRRSARNAVDQADRSYHIAVAKQERLHSTLRPILTEHSRAANQVRDIETSLGPTRQLIDLDGHHRQAERLHRLAVALDDWHHWANGHLVDPILLRRTAHVLQHQASVDLRLACRALASALPEGLQERPTRSGMPEAERDRVVSQPRVDRGFDLGR